MEERKQLGGARRLVRRDLLRVLQSAAVLEVGGDAGGAECVAADLRLDAGSLRPPESRRAVQAVRLPLRGTKRISTRLLSAAAMRRSIANEWPS